MRALHILAALVAVLVSLAAVPTGAADTGEEPMPADCGEGKSCRCTGALIAWGGGDRSGEKGVICSPLDSRGPTCEPVQVRPHGECKAKLLRLARIKGWGPIAVEIEDHLDCVTQ